MTESYILSARDQLHSESKLSLCFGRLSREELFTCGAFSEPREQSDFKRH